MNLSISNSRKLPTAFLIFIAIFILGEYAISKSSHIIIKQKRILFAYNKIVKEEGIDIVAIGHSAVETGINTPLLSELLSAHNYGKKIKCYNLAIGDLPIGVAYFVFKNIIIPARPSLVIIGFWGDEIGRSNIESFDTYHTLRDYTRFNDVLVLFKVSLTDFNDKVDFILRKMSYTYSYRHIIKHGIDLIFHDIIMNKKLPTNLMRARTRQLREIEQQAGFRPFSGIGSPLINIGADTASEKIKEKRKNLNSYRYYYFSKIIDLARRQDIRLLFIAMPRQGGAGLSHEAKAFLNRNDISLLNLGNVKKYDNYFLDACHLNKEGTKLLTEDIASFLLQNTKMYYREKA